MGGDADAAAAVPASRTAVDACGLPVALEPVERRANVSTYYHPTSTAPMGGPADPQGVVDSVGTVKGVNGLRVVDASIFPEIPSTVTNLTAMMLAERIHQRVYQS